MRKQHLYEYTNEILDIAKKNDLDVSKAVDAFLNNVSDYGKLDDQYFYHGADTVDYGALHEVYAEIQPEGKALTEALKEHYGDITDLRNAGKRAEIVLLMKSLLDSDEAAK